MPMTASSAPIADIPIIADVAADEPVRIRNCSRIGLRANPPRRRLIDLFLRGPRA